MIDYEKLEKKGWQEKDIIKVRSVFSKEPEQKAYKFFNKIFYWLTILFAITVNISVSILVIPFIIVAIKNFSAYFFTAIISFAFGLFFDLLINQMKTFDYENKIIEGLFIPAMAIVNMVFIFLVIRMYSLITLSMLFVLINILIYGIFFNLPYLIGYTARKIRNS